MFTEYNVFDREKHMRAMRATYEDVMNKPFGAYPVGFDEELNADNEEVIVDTDIIEEKRKKEKEMIKETTKQDEERKIDPNGVPREFTEMQLIRIAFEEPERIQLFDEEVIIDGVSYPRTLPDERTGILYVTRQYEWSEKYLLMKAERDKEQRILDAEKKRNEEFVIEQAYLFRYAKAVQEVPRKRVQEPLENAILEMQEKMDNNEIEYDEDHEPVVDIESLLLDLDFIYADSQETMVKKLEEINASDDDYYSKIDMAFEAILIGVSDDMVLYIADELFTKYNKRFLVFGEYLAIVPADEVDHWRDQALLVPDKFLELGKAVIKLTADKFEPVEKVEEPNFRFIDEEAQKAFYEEFGVHFYDLDIERGHGMSEQDIFREQTKFFRSVPGMREADMNYLRSKGYIPPEEREEAKRKYEERFQGPNGENENDRIAYLERRNKNLEMDREMDRLVQEYYDNLDEEDDDDYDYDCNYDCNYNDYSHNDQPMKASFYDMQKVEEDKIYDPLYGEPLIFNKYMPPVNQSTEFGDDFEHWLFNPSPEEAARMMETLNELDRLNDLPEHEYQKAIRVKDDLDDDEYDNLHASCGAMKEEVLRDMGVFIPDFRDLQFNTRKYSHDPETRRIEEMIYSWYDEVNPIPYQIPPNPNFVDEVKRGRVKRNWMNPNYTFDQIPPEYWTMTEEEIKEARTKHSNAMKERDRRVEEKMRKIKQGGEKIRERRAQRKHKRDFIKNIDPEEYRRLERINEEEIKQRIKEEHEKNTFDAKNVIIENMYMKEQLKRELSKIDMSKKKGIKKAKKINKKIMDCDYVINQLKEKYDVSEKEVKINKGNPIKNFFNGVKNNITGFFKGIKKKAKKLFKGFGNFIVDNTQVIATLGIAAAGIFKTFHDKTNIVS